MPYKVVRHNALHSTVQIMDSDGSWESGNLNLFIVHK